MNPDLVKVTEIFLVPVSILVGALGVAITEQLKTGISVLGLIIAILWSISSWDALGAIQAIPTRREWILGWLPLLFLIGWLISGIVHARLWSKIPRKISD